MNIVFNTIGRSDKRGAIATLIPSPVPYFNVSEITSVNNGPGDNPELRPKTTPENMKVISDVMNL